MKRRAVQNLMDGAEASVQLVERNPAPLGVQLVDPSRVGKKDHSALVQLAYEISQAENAVTSNACGKLELIAEQIRFLQNQARNILEESKLSLDLHQAACNFQKRPGSTYFLYKKPSGQTYFSMLSIQDWNGSPPHEFLGAYRLEHDSSWTPTAHLERKNSSLAVARRIFDSYHESTLGPNIVETMMIDN